MDPSVQANLIGSISGMLLGWAMIFVYYKVGGRAGNRGEARPHRLSHDENFYPMFGYPITDWERVFIWTPVRMHDRGLIFPMQFVWRRRVIKKMHLDGGPDFWWQYVKVLRVVTS